MSEIGLYGGQLLCDVLTLDVLNKSPKIYETYKMIYWGKLLRDGMIPTRWLKPTKKGQKVNFKTVKNTLDYNRALREYQTYCENINEMHFGGSLECVKFENIED